MTPNLLPHEVKQLVQEARERAAWLRRPVEEQRSISEVELKRGSTLLETLAAELEARL